MILSDANPSELALVLAHTHALWGDGLAISEYEEFITTLMASEWAREGRYRFLVAKEATTGPIVAALKLYRFRARLQSEVIEVGGVGAIFTLPDHRRRGVAAAMLARVHELMAARGDVASILFSEIGSSYYAGLGYRELPGREEIFTVPSASPAPRDDEGDIVVSRFHRDDLDLVETIRSAARAGASFDLTRDPSFWKYLLARASFPTLHLGRETWESRLMIARGPEAAAYLWARFKARVVEIIDFEPTVPSQLLLDDLFEECRRRGVSEVRGCPSGAIPMWLPLDTTKTPQLEVAMPDWRFQGVEIF